MSRRSLQLTLALVCLCWLGCFLLFSVGELIFDLFLTSSNNLTATVESNAATEKKKLMYGAEHCWNGMINMHLRQPSLNECLSDNQFLSFLDHDDVPSDPAQRRYPPVALIECVADLI